MIGELLRAAHAPAWLVFVLIFGLYIMTAGWWMLNGYTRELFGSPLPHMGRIHKVVYNFHTGLPVRNMKTSGDQRNLKRVAGNTNRATPSGETVYWHKWPRWARATRNNTIITAWLLSSCGMALNPVLTIRIFVNLFVLCLIALAVVIVRRARKRHAQKRPVSQKATARTAKARIVLRADPLTAGATPKLEEEKVPQLEGVPATVLASLLAQHMSCSTAELLNRLSMRPERGSISPLPDSFGALQKQREPVEELIRAHTEGRVEFTWVTTRTPRQLIWDPVQVQSLPASVRFRDYLSEMEKLPPREFGIGVVANRGMYVGSHNGDFPWHCRFAGPGTGKTTGFLVKAAQICHKDPKAELHCIDTKQVSFAPLRGIPRVHIYDKPQSEMYRIWEVWYELHKMMTDRYTAIAEGRMTVQDLHDIWILIDEGNDLAACLKSYSRNVLGVATAPLIWGEAIAPIFRMGRQACMFGEFMCQDLDGRMFGGETLKTAFNIFGAAGFSPNQFSRVMGGKAEECIDGPGKILMCKGKKREWVQAFYDDEQFLHDYALENRK